MKITIKVEDVELILDEQTDVYTNIKYHNEATQKVVKTMTECVDLLLKNRCADFHERLIRSLDEKIKNLRRNKIKGEKQ